jgi:hypothetical protein
VEHLLLFCLHSLLNDELNVNFRLVKKVVILSPSEFTDLRPLVDPWTPG